MSYTTTSQNPQQENHLNEYRRKRLDSLLADSPEIRSDGVFVLYVPSKRQPWIVLVQLFNDGGWQRVEELARHLTNGKARSTAAAARAYIASKQVGAE